MQIKALNLQNYRNYTRQSCDFCPSLNLLIGSNAQGKTNLIEAIYYLSIGKAYRPMKDEQLIRWEQSSFHIQGTVANRQGQAVIEIQYDKNAKQAKNIRIGGLPLQKNDELSGHLTSVLFSPDNMSIIKGAPQERRRFLDYDISQISRVYAKNLQKYQRLLVQRNMLLKRLNYKKISSQEKVSELAIWDEQLIATGEEIIEKRLQTIAKLTPLTRLMQRKLSGGQENLELHYIFNRKEALQQGPSLRDKLTQARQESFEEDLKYGVTQWGPHRDDLAITINGIALKQYGSQGQQRTAVLALKLAELEFFRGESGEYPILLLDDVMSELDQERRQQLIQIIREKKIQCFITSTDNISFDNDEKRQIYTFEVNNGRIQRLKELD